MILGKRCSRGAYALMGETIISFFFSNTPHYWFGRIDGIRLPWSQSGVKLHKPGLD